MNKFLSLSPQACYVLVLRGKLSEVSGQLKTMSDKVGKLTIGELMKLDWLNGQDEDRAIEASLIVGECAECAKAIGMEG